MGRFTSRFADRGADAERAVSKFLLPWGQQPGHEANRLPDTKAAGRIIKAAPADFDYFCSAGHGLIETKETKHDFRLARDKLTQLPRLRLRQNAGGRCYVLVLHSELDQWRILDVPFLMAPNDKGSWNLTALPLFPTPEAALRAAAPEAFA